MCTIFFIGIPIEPSRMSDSPRKTVRVNPETIERPFNYLQTTMRVRNASKNKSVPIKYGKNARGFRGHFPEGNYRSSPMYLPNDNGGVFKSTTVLGNSVKMAQRMQENKETLRAGVNEPTLRRTRRGLSAQEAFNKANRKESFIEHATYRNTGRNITPMKNYEMMEEEEQNMNNIIREGENAYIAAGQENRNHARYAAELNAREADTIAHEAAAAAAAGRGLVRRNATRNLLSRPRSKSARKTRKARKSRRN